MIREQLSEVQLDKLREISASVSDKGPKDWKSLYSTTISARNQGKINSREELAKSLGVSVSNVSSLISPSSSSANKAIRQQLSEVQLDKLREINNSVLSDKSGKLSQTRLKGDLFEKAISILSGQPFKKGADALDFSRAQARPVLMDSKIREQIDLGQDVRYGDAESGSGHKVHIMRDKVIRELEEGGQLYNLIQKNGDINLPGKTFTDIVANGSDAKPKESSTIKLGELLNTGRTTAGTKNAIEKSLTKKYKGKITPAQRQKEYQRNVKFDYYVDDVNLENLKVDKRTKLGKELGDIDKQFLAVSAQTQSDGLVPNFASLRSPIKFDVGDEKSYGKSYVARTAKSGKLFLLEQGHKHFSEYMESQGKPTPKMTRGVIGGREGYWVNQHEDDILEWSKKPNIEYIRKEKEVKEQREQESKDYMQKLKYGSFEPIKNAMPLNFGGDSVRYQRTSGFGKELINKLGPDYKYISVNTRKVEDYAKANNITKQLRSGSTVPNSKSALLKMVDLPKSKIQELDFVRPRKRTEDEKKEELREISPTSPIKWDVRQNPGTKKKDYSLKGSDDTFRHFSNFLERKGVPKRSIQNIQNAIQQKRETIKGLEEGARKKSQSRSDNTPFYEAALASENIEKNFSIPTDKLYIKNLSNLIKEFNSTVYTGFSDGYVPDYGAVEMNKGYVPNFIGFNVPKKSHQLIETFNQITEKNKLIPTVDSLMEQGVDRETAIQQTKDDQFGQKKSMFKILNTMKSEGVKQLFFGQGGKIFPHQSAGTIPFTIEKIKDVINNTGYKTDFKADGFVPNYAVTLSDDNYYSQKNVQHGITQLYKKSGGRQKLAPKELEFAAERYISAVQDSGKTYPGGNFNVGGKKFNFNEVSMSLMKHGQFYQPKEGEAVDLSEGFAGGYVPNFADSQKIRNGAIYHSKTNNKAVRVKRADQAERIAHIKHHTQDHMFDPEVPFSDLTPATKKQVQEYLGRSPTKAKGFVPNFADTTLYRGQGRPTLDTPDILSNLPSFSGAETPEDVVGIIQNFVKSHVSGKLSGQRDKPNPAKKASGAVSFSTNNTIAREFSGLGTIRRKAANPDGKVFEKKVPQKNIFNKRKLLKILSRGADLENNVYPKVQEFKQAISSGAIQNWAQENGGIFLNVSGTYNDQEAYGKMGKMEYGRFEHKFLGKRMPSIVPPKEIGFNKNKTFEITPREEEVMQVFDDGLVPNFADPQKIRNGAIYNSKTNNKAVRVVRANQAERIAYIKHHSQDHMFDPEVPFSDLTPATKKQVQEYLGKKPKAKAKGFVPNYALTGKEYAKFSVSLSDFVRNNSITPPIKSLSSREIFKIPRRNAEVAEQTIQNIRQFISSNEFGDLDEDIRRQVKKDYNRIAPRGLSNPFRPFAKYSQKEFSGSMDVGRPTLRRAVAKGFVPNFASPLKEAIKREKAAGVPVSSIRVEKSPQLKSSKNPMGLAVTNTRDEPLGVGQGIRRARSMGIDPKKHGASKGLVPNFAAGIKNIQFKEGVPDAVKKAYNESAKHLNSFNKNIETASDASGKRAEADSNASNKTDDFSSGGLMKLFVFQSLLSTANGFLQEFAESGGETAKTFAQIGQAGSNLISTLLTTKEVGNQLMEMANIKPSQSVGLGGLIRGGGARRGATKEIAGGLKAAIDFKGVKNATGAISSFGKGLSMAGKGLLRFTPIVGQLLVVGTAINEVMKMVTGKGLFDLLKSDADRAAGKLKELAEASEKTQNAIESTSKLEQTNNRIKELSIKGSAKTNKEQIEFINLQTQRIKEETKLQQTVSKLESANKSNESIVRLINQAKSTEVTNTEKLNEILQKIALEEVIEQSVTSVVKTFSKEMENLPDVSSFIGGLGFSVDKSQQRERRAEFRKREQAQQGAFEKVAIRIGDSLAGISMPEIKAEKIEDIKAGRFGEISESAGEIFQDLSASDQKKLQKLILNAIKNAEKSQKEKEEQVKAEKGAKDEFIKRLFLIKQGREQEALTLKLANKRNELYRKQNEFLDNVLSEYGGITAAAKIEADAARKTAKIRSDYNEKLLDANQKALQGAEEALKGVFGEKSPETAEKLFGKVGDKDARPIQFTEQEAANAGITKQQKNVANQILKEASKQKSSFSQLTVLYDELAKTKDEELHGAILRLVSDRGLMDISQKQKNKLKEINTTLENKKATLDQDLELSIENIKQERIRSLISKKTTEGAIALQNILSQGIPYAQTAITAMEGNAATLKVLNDFRSAEVETILQSAALQAEATQLQKEKNRNDLIAVTKSAAQAKAQAEVFSKTERYAQIIQKRLEQEISQSEIAARDAQLKNEFYNIESNRLALVKSQLQSEIDNLNTDNLIKQSRLELLTQYGKINELVAGQIQQSRLQATTDLATSIETAQQTGTPESMVDVAEKMSALNREMNTGSRAMDALRERLAEAQVNAANLGADLVNIGFDQAKSGLKQLFKDIGSGAKSASEAWESFGLNIADSLLDRIMEHNIDKMMSNLSVAFTGQDLLADANQRLAATIPTLKTSNDTLNTTTGALNTSMGTLNTSVQGLTTAIGSINLNPGQPTVDVTIPSTPAQGPAASAPVEKFLGGKIQAFNKGGFVKGEPGIDRVPAMLTAGEYVLNKEQVNEVQKQGPSMTASKPDQFFMESPKQISKNIAPKKTFEDNITGKLKLFKGGVVQMFQDGGLANKKIDKGVFDVEKRIIDKKQVQEIQNKEVLNVKQSPVQELSINTAKISNMVSPEKALKGSKELGDIKKFYGGKIQKFEEGGIAKRVKAGAKGAAQFAVMTGVSSVLSKKLNKKQDNPPPKFDMRKLDTLNLGSDVNIKRGDPRLSARFIAEDPVMQEYRDHLLELATYRAQKTNEKFREKQGTLASVMGAVMSFAVGQLVSAAAGPIQKSIQKGKNFMGKTMGQHKDAYKNAMSIPGGKDLNYSQVSEAIKSNKPLMIGGREWTIDKTGTEWMRPPNRPVNRQGGGSIPAMLTAGEGFVPAPIARRIGYGNLNKMNQTGSLPIINGPAGIDKVGPVGLNEGDFIIKKSSTDKLLRENPNMMKFALQNPEGFKKGERGYYEGGVVGTATRAAPVASKTYKPQSAPEQRNRISSLIEEVDQTKAQESAQSTSNSVTNNINVNVSIDKSGNESVSTEQTGSSLEQEKDLSMKIKAKVLEVIRDEKRIGGELS